MKNKKIPLMGPLTRGRVYDIANVLVIGLAIIVILFFAVSVLTGCGSRAPNDLISHLKVENARLHKQIDWHICAVKAEVVEDEPPPDPLVVAVETIADSVIENTIATREQTDEIHGASEGIKQWWAGATGGGGLLAGIAGILGFQHIQRSRKK